MLKVVNSGTETRVEHDGGTAPASVLAPSKREAEEALRIVKLLLGKGYADAQLDVLARFVSTR